MDGQDTNWSGQERPGLDGQIWFALARQAWAGSGEADKDRSALG